MTALIETVRVMGGRAPLWPLHVARLRAAASALHMKIAIPDAPAGGADRVARYELSANGTDITTRDPAIPAALRLRVSVVLHPAYSWKTTDRQAFDMARAEARAHGADDALLLSADGLVREASRWAVVWRRADGRIGAPPLATGVLRSVARARLGQLLEPELVDQELNLEALARCPVAAMNAARGLVPVRELEGVVLPFWSGWAQLAERFWP